MNTISGTGFSRGFGVSAVVHLRQNEPIQSAGTRFGGDEVILAAVQHPPRTGETRPIASLLPQVLARYGLAECDHAPASRSAFDIRA